MQVYLHSEVSGTQTHNVSPNLKFTSGFILPHHGCLWAEVMMHIAWGVILFPISVAVVLPQMMLRQPRAADGSELVMALRVMRAKIASVPRLDQSHHLPLFFSYFIRQRQFTFKTCFLGLVIHGCFYDGLKLWQGTNASSFRNRIDSFTWIWTKWPHVPVLGWLWDTIDHFQLVTLGSSLGTIMAPHISCWLL